MRKSISAILLPAVLAVFAAAGIAHAGQRVVIWSQPYGEEADAAVDAVIADYNKANPDVTVVYERRANNDHKVALRVAATGGTGPDIYQMWGGLGLGGEFVNAGFSAPLNDYYAQYKWDEKLLPAALSDSRRYKSPERHGVPFRMTTQGLYFNKKLFEKAGITAIPATYDELVAACEKLKAANIAPITFGGSVNWHLMRLMDVLLEKNCGVEVHDQLKAMSVSWDGHPGAVKSFEDLKQWGENYALKPFMGMGADQSRTLFYQGRAAMILEADFMVPRIAAAANIDDFDFFLFPTATNRLYFYAELWYVNPNSTVKDAAAKFIDYFVSKETQERLAGKMGMVMVNPAVEYAAADDLPIKKKWREAYASRSETFPNGDQGFPFEVTMEYFRIINAVASGGMAPADAAKQMQVFIDANRK